MHSIEFIELTLQLQHAHLSAPRWHFQGTNASPNGATPNTTKCCLSPLNMKTMACLITCMLFPCLYTKAHFIGAHHNIGMSFSKIQKQEFAKAHVFVASYVLPNKLIAQALTPTRLHTNQPAIHQYCRYLRKLKSPAHYAEGKGSNGTSTNTPPKHEL